MVVWCGEELVGAQPVVFSVVEQCPVGQADKAASGGLVEVEGDTGRNTRATSAITARQSGMWWTLAKSNTRCSWRRRTRA
jgi:hypothetical protein